MLWGKIKQEDEQEVQHMSTCDDVAKFDFTKIVLPKWTSEGSEGENQVNVWEKNVSDTGKLSSVMSHSATPWTAGHQAPLSITNSQRLLKLVNFASVMPSNHLILLSPSPPTFNLSQHQSLFKWVSSSHQVAKVLEVQLQNQSFQWTPRTILL